MGLVKKLPKQLILELAKVSNTKSALYLASDWLGIFTAIAVTEGVGSWWLYPIAVMFIANRQHSFAIAMHDASHGRLFTNQKINDFAGDVICSWPMFFSMYSYRANHRLHHLYSNTKKDPDFRRERFPKTRGEIVKMLLTDLIGLNTFQQLGELKRFRPQNVSRTSRLGRVGFMLTLAAALTYFHAWNLFALYWIVPLFTWLKVVLRLRAIADHAGVHTNDYPYDTRTVIPTVFDRIFLAPRHCSYHFGHHLLQSIPSYNLKRFHQEMMKLSDYRQNARVTRGFHRLITEFPSAKDLEMHKISDRRIKTTRAAHRRKVS